jgi:DNA-binding protein YbaB
MTTTDLAEATTLKKQIDDITAVQAKIATTGSQGALIVLTTSGVTSVSKSDLVAALGDGAYDTVCDNAVSALNTALASAKTAAQSDLAAL